MYVKFPLISNSKPFPWNCHSVIYYPAIPHYFLHPLRLWNSDSQLYAYTCTCTLCVNISEPAVDISCYGEFFPKITCITICLHHSTGTHITTVFIYECVGQPSLHAICLTYIQKCRKSRSTKAGHENPQKPAGEKTWGTCTPDQGSGATLGV